MKGLVVHDVVAMFSFRCIAITLFVAKKLWNRWKCLFAGSHQILCNDEDWVQLSWMQWMRSTGQWSSIHMCRNIYWSWSRWSYHRSIYWKEATPRQSPMRSGICNIGNALMVPSRCCNARGKEVSSFLLSSAKTVYGWTSLLSSST